MKGLSRVDSLEHILRMGHLQLDEKTKVKLMDQKTFGTSTWSRAWASDILPGAKELIEELVAEGIRVGLGSSRNAHLFWTTWG